MPSTAPTQGQRLPPRYATPWRDAFDERIRPALLPDGRVLDVGAGRRTTIPPTSRPPGLIYEGLDLSRAELERAPVGSYDSIHVADVAHRLPALECQFDLIVSWQVLEHVKPLEVALENLRSYLKPGGQLVAQLSGRFSAFGIINLAVPAWLARWSMGRLLGRDPGTVFPAYYDRCWSGALKRALETWSTYEVVPRYRAAGYFSFAPLIERAYIRYEQWSRRHDNLATHYLIRAVR